MKTIKYFDFCDEQIRFDNQDYLVSFSARCERQGECYDDLELVDVEVDNIELAFDTEDGAIAVDINNVTDNDYKKLTKQLEEFVSEQDLDWNGEDIVNEYAEFNGYYNEYSGRWS